LDAVAEPFETEYAVLLYIGLYDKPGVPVNTEPHTTGRFEGFQLLFHPLGLLAASAYIVRLLQPEKALLPILVTVDGIIILFKFVQFWNALSAIVVTWAGMTKLPLNAAVYYPEPFYGILCRVNNRIRGIHRAQALKRT